MTDPLTTAGERLAAAAEDRIEAVFGLLAAQNKREHAQAMRTRETLKLCVANARGNTILAAEYKRGRDALDIPISQLADKEMAALRWRERCHAKYLKALNEVLSSRPATPDQTGTAP